MNIPNFASRHHAIRASRWAELSLSARPVEAKPTKKSANRIKLATEWILFFKFMA
jgi:hypothetical protein